MDKFIEEILSKDEEMAKAFFNEVFADRIGNAIILANSKLKLKDTEIAKRAGVPTELIQKLINGYTEVSINDANKVLNVFGMTLSGRPMPIKECVEELGDED